MRYRVSNEFSIIDEKNNTRTIDFIHYSDNDIFNILANKDFKDRDNYTDFFTDDIFDAINKLDNYTFNSYDISIIYITNFHYEEELKEDLQEFIKFVKRKYGEEKGIIIIARLTTSDKANEFMNEIGFESVNDRIGLENSIPYIYNDNNTIIANKIIKYMHDIASNFKKENNN